MSTKQLNWIEFYWKIINDAIICKFTWAWLVSRIFQAIFFPLITYEQTGVFLHFSIQCGICYCLLNSIFVLLLVVMLMWFISFSFVILLQILAFSESSFNFAWFYFNFFKITTKIWKQMFLEPNVGFRLPLTLIITNDFSVVNLLLEQSTPCFVINSIKFLKFLLCFIFFSLFLRPIINFP